MLTARSAVRVPFWTWLLVLTLIPSPSARSQSARPPALLVTSRFTDEVLLYDGSTGAPLGVFASGGGLDNPVGLTFGPDGDLYVASGDTDQVLRYDGRTGAFVGVFAESGPINGPRNLNFGPDGHLYLASGSNDRILHYDGETGAFLGTFFNGSLLNGLQGPTSFTFGPDGDLYAAGVISNKVVRIDGQTGASLGVFTQAGLSGPHDLTFGPDGDLYVVNAFVTTVRRYDGETGQSVGIFVNDPALENALGLAWGLDGDLYLANQGGSEIRRYDGTTGAFLDSFVGPGAGGLDGAMFLAFLPEPLGPSVRPPTLERPDVVAVTGARPGAAVLVRLGLTPGSASFPGCGSAVLGIADPVALGVRMADESGHVVLTHPWADRLSGALVLLQAVNVERGDCHVGPLLAHPMP